MHHHFAHTQMQNNVYVRVKKYIEKIDGKGIHRFFLSLIQFKSLNIKPIHRLNGLQIASSFYF